MDKLLLERNISYRKLPWILFGFLIIIFYFAQVHDLDYSIEFASSWETEILDSDTKAEIIQSGTLGRRIGVLTLGLIGIFWFIRYRANKLRINGVIGFAIIFFLLWVYISIFWSDDYMLTARRSISFTLLWIAALGFNFRFTEREIIKFFFIACLTYVLSDMAIELYLGAFPPTSLYYRFTGTLGPNPQALNCAGLAIAGIVLWNVESRHRILFLILGIVGFIALVLTRSRIGVTGCLMALLVYSFLVSKKRTVVFYTISILSLLCLLLLIFGPESIFNGNSKKVILLGRMADVVTLTGRVPIWEFGMDYFFQRPLLGYGFNSFETIQRLDELERHVGWGAGNMHSEYLNLLVGVGIIGMITFLFISAGSLLKTFFLFRKSQNKYHAISCAILIFYFTAMLLENVSLMPNVPTFMAFIIMTRRGFVAEHVMHRPEKRFID